MLLLLATRDCLAQAQDRRSPLVTSQQPSWLLPLPVAARALLYTSTSSQSTSVGKLGRRRKAATCCRRQLWRGCHGHAIELFITASSRLQQQQCLLQRGGSKAAQHRCAQRWQAASKLLACLYAIVMVCSENARICDSSVEHSDVAR